MDPRTAPPGATGLYDPANEHDACGIALVAKLWGEASHAVVEKALDALENLEHRGAEGADPNTGDGAGILLQIPDGFLRAAVAGVELPPPGRYGVGVCYLPTDPERRLALVHSRFSTNTFPSWELAHPYRMIAHNGEVNTLRGNVNWMRARESQLASDLFGDDLGKVIPVVREGGSDSAIFDNVLELLVLSGRSIEHAVMMMVPEAYRTRTDLDPDVKGFYDFHSCLMEPWDGPAAVVFTDGRLAGAVLDRNGLRRGRLVQDTEGYVVPASEP